jgi:hypothetical protein
VNHSDAQNFDPKYGATSCSQQYRYSDLWTRTVITLNLGTGEDIRDGQDGGPHHPGAGDGGQKGGAEDGQGRLQGASLRQLFGHLPHRQQSRLGRYMEKLQFHYRETD